MTAFIISTLRGLLALALLGMASCRQMEPWSAAAPPAPLPPTAKPPAKPGASRPSSLFEWSGAGLSGPVAVRIDLSQQKAQLMRGGQPAGWTYVATGTSRHPTPAGSFRISEKQRYKRSSSWGTVVNAAGHTVDSNARNGRTSIPAGGRFVGASMPYWMRVNGAIGMHAGPIPAPGSPASHGCIRLPRGMAEILFEATVVGTPVTIVP